MYHLTAQGVDERMINVHYYYYVDVVIEHLLKTVTPDLDQL